MNISVILKSLMNNFLAKKSFIVPWPAEEVLTKNMNMLLMFCKKLKQKK